MSTEPASATAPVQPIVMQSVAVADAKYVLTWLLQCHDLKRDRGETLLPEGIESLARRAMSAWNDEFTDARTVALSRALESLMDAVERSGDWADETRVGRALLAANRVLTGSA